MKDQCQRMFKSHAHADFTHQCQLAAGHAGEHQTYEKNPFRWLNGDPRDRGDRPADLNARQPAPDPRDAEIAAQRAEIKRMCEERDSAQRCIEKLTRELSEPVARLQRALSDDDGFKVACEALVVEKRLREKAEARVAELEALTPPGHVLVGPDARERIARALWEHDRAKSGNHGWSSEWAGLEPGSWAQVYGFQADAALSALGVRGGA